MRLAKINNKILKADDVEMNLSLKKYIKCRFCSVQLEFVRTHIKNKVQIPCFFRLAKGKKQHHMVNGEPCPYNIDNPNTCTLDNSDTLKTNSNIDKSLYCRVNIPSHINAIKETIENELLLTDATEVESKKSPGIYKTSGRKKSDYINTARGFSNLATKHWPSEKSMLFKIKFEFPSYTATWFDLYYENWDFLYNKLKTNKPKYPVCLRGVLSSHKITRDSITLFYIKKSISTKTVSNVYCSIELPRYGFEYLEHELNEIKEKGLKREITFFGEIEKTHNNIVGKGYYRKQIYIKPLSKKYY